MIDNIKMDLKETVSGCGMDCSGAGQGPVASTCEHGYELSSPIESG
jgi:hypothetical protein